MDAGRSALAVVCCVLCMGPALTGGDTPARYVYRTEQGVAVSEMTSRRERRQTNDRGMPDKRGLTPDEKRLYLHEHNKWRQQAPATDMKFMYWDDNLAAMAQAYAEQCVFEHSTEASRTAKYGYNYIGENLFAGTGLNSLDPVYVVNAWHEEIEGYDYRTLACSIPMCGHYTQIVWATSYAVGCGVAYCPVLRKVSFGHGYNVACNYGPGGNYRGQHPYTTDGDACTKCDDLAPYCVAGTCARYPMILGGRSRLFVADKTNGCSHHAPSPGLCAALLLVCLLLLATGRPPSVTMPSTV